MPKSKSKKNTQNSANDTEMTLNGSGANESAGVGVPITGIDPNLVIKVLTDHNQALVKEVAALRKQIEVLVERDLAFSKEANADKKKLEKALGEQKEAALNKVVASTVATPAAGTGTPGGTPAAPVIPWSRSSIDKPTYAQAAHALPDDWSQQKLNAARNAFADANRRMLSRPSAVSDAYERLFFGNIPRFPRGEKGSVSKEGTPLQKLKGLLFDGGVPLTQIKEMAYVSNNVVEMLVRKAASEKVINRVVLLGGVFRHDYDPSKPFNEDADDEIYDRCYSAHYFRVKRVAEHSNNLESRLFYRKILDGLQPPKAKPVSDPSIPADSEGFALVQNRGRKRGPNSDAGRSDTSPRIKFVVDGKQQLMDTVKAQELVDRVLSCTDPDAMISDQDYDLVHRVFRESFPDGILDWSKLADSKRRKTPQTVCQ